MNTIESPLSTRFLEIALIINNVDIGKKATPIDMDGTIISEYHKHAKSRNGVIDDTKNISSFIRYLCYSYGVDIGPIVCLLDNDNNVNDWLTNLETVIIPYLISCNIIEKNKG